MHNLDLFYTHPTVRSLAEKHPACEVDELSMMNGMIRLVYDLAWQIAAKTSRGEPLNNSAGLVSRYYHVVEGRVRYETKLCIKPRTSVILRAANGRISNKRVAYSIFGTLLSCSSVADFDMGAPDEIVSTAPLAEWLVKAWDVAALLHDRFDLVGMLTQN